jgi:hypothetical protein
MSQWTGDNKWKTAYLKSFRWFVVWISNPRCYVVDVGDRGRDKEKSDIRTSSFHTANDDFKSATARLVEDVHLVCLSVTLLWREKKNNSEAHFVDQEQLDLREYVPVIFPTIVNEE